MLFGLLSVAGLRIYEHFNTAEGKIGPLTSGSDASPLLKQKGHLLAISCKQMS